jgi:hypothetical protein
MTVIAWDGKTLAADKLASRYGTCLTTTKIWRVGDILVGGAGPMDAIAEMKHWIISGRDPLKFPCCQKYEERATIVVIERCAIIEYNRSPHYTVYEDPFYAIGTGREFAIAALACGKTAEQAVEIACQYDADCGNGIDTLKWE